MKRIIKAVSCVLCFIMSLCFCSCQTSAASGISKKKPYDLLGDADGDGEITITDATTIQRHLVSLITLSKDAQACADTNGSGDIDITDTTQIQRYLAEFEIPYKIGEPIKQNKEDETEAMVQTGFTEQVPSAYLTSADKQGTVQRIEYESKDYAGNGEAIAKEAYVYLPYGYDENDTETRYNILYLMHGWGGHVGEYFEYANIKNIFDNMIANGDVAPMIIVSATFYHENSGTDFTSSEREFRAFHNDFEKHLMSAVEGRFHTYARSTSDADLKASRDHRAFGGFSLGSVTTWLEFCYDYDYVRYFLPMSGSSWYYGTYGDFQTKKNVDFIQSLVEKNNLDERGYFIYHAVGTQDPVKSQTIMQADEMLARDDVFTSEHYVFYQKEGGVHDHYAVREFLYNALPHFFTEQAEMNKEYFTKDTPITDVMNDPAFGNYGRLIFPVNSGYYSGDTLGNLSLTWYNYIDPDKTVEIVNYMKNHAVSGDQIFYDIYTDEEKAADPDKQNTGLFFFKGEKNKPFAICNAGGGFAYIGAMHDSFPHALELSKKGYNAFALIYRPDYAYEDLAKAIEFIHDNADKLEVNPNSYSLWGGSAGARMAATLGNADYLNQLTRRSDIPQASAVIMQYTGYTNTSRNDAPTYACVGTSDWIADWRTMQRRLNTLDGYGIPTEFHSYEGLPHGFGLGTGTVAEGWFNDAVDFWGKQMD